MWYRSHCVACCCKQLVCQDPLWASKGPEHCLPQYLCRCGRCLVSCWHCKGKSREQVNHNQYVLVAIPRAPQGQVIRGKGHIATLDRTQGCPWPAKHWGHSLPHLCLSLLMPIQKSLSRSAVSSRDPLAWPRATWYWVHRVFLSFSFLHVFEVASSTVDQ